MKLDFIDTLFESTSAANPRIPHPEDSIFTSSAEAERYLQAMEAVIKNPANVTIKWDGGIALYFGRRPDGKFFVSDKYMYPKGIMAASPEEWKQYDETKPRGAPRLDLHPKLSAIWSGLEAAVGETQGVFMGDLMHAGKLEPINGNYVFAPTTVTYTIPVDSPFGKLITGKAGIVVVHKYNDEPWDGVTGLTNSGNVAIITPTAGNKFSLNQPVQLVKAARAAIASSGSMADEFRLGLGAKNAVDTIKTYFNKTITGQIDQTLDHYLTAYPAQYNKIIESGYLQQNQEGFLALEKIWNALYALKVDLVNQLNAQVKGFQQSINGVPGGEGFVFTDPVLGLVKLVIRGQGGFGVAHFNKPR